MILLYALLFLIVASPSNATRYWVSTTGSDANSCVSVSGDNDPGTYKLTPAGGIACLGTSDTLTIKAGTYNNTSARIRNIPSGVAGNPTIIEGDPSSTTGCALAHTCGTILKPTSTGTNSYPAASHYIIRKIDFDHQAVGGVVADNSYPLHIGQPCTDVLLEDIETHSTLNTVYQASGIMIDNGCSFVTLDRVYSHDNGLSSGSLGGHGLYLQGTDVTVQNSRFSHNGYIGAQCYSSSGVSPDRCKFYHNIIDTNRGQAIANEGNDPEFVGNLVYGNLSGGIQYGYGGSANAKIWKNTLYNNPGFGIICGDFNGCLNATIQDNLLFSNTAEVLIRAGATGSTASYNACTAASSCGTTGKVSITAITDCTVSTSDFSQKSGSSCIDVGTALSGFSHNGSAPDIGAMESFGFGSGTVTASTMEVSLAMNINTPVIPTTAGWSIACTPSPTACPTPVISSVVLKSGSSSVVQITWTGGNCDTSQNWTVSYSATTGATTDTWHLLAMQELSTFTTQAVTNSCVGGGGGGGSPPGGLKIHYKFEEGTGTNANDETANNLDGTLTNTPTWVSGYTGTGINIASGSTQYVAVSYGSGVNPSTQDLTFAVWVYVTPGSESTASMTPIATPVGTNQRMYILAQSGTWRIAIQSSNASTASDLSVASGWNRICLQMNSGTDTATLYNNGVAATSSGGVKTYTSYTFSGNLQMGQLPANTSGPGIYDEFKVWDSLVSCVDDYTSYTSTPSVGGTFSQPTHKFQAVYTTAASSVVSLGANGAMQNVVDGGAVAIIFQVNCDNVADCSATSFTLRYSTDGTNFNNTVPDTATSDGVRFWGSTFDTYLNTGVATGPLTGALTHTNGTTQITADAIPSLDLAQNTSATLRYIIKFSPGLSGQSRYFKLYQQSGQALGSYTPSSGARVIIIPAQGSGGK